ncbi:MAG: acyltransferase domain-containing protein [Fibrobacterota bacterium]
MPDERLPFLDKANIPGRLKALGLSNGLFGPLNALTDIIDADENLRRLAWYLHWRVFITPEKNLPWGAPPLLNRLGQQAGLFYLLLSLEFAPRLAEWHRTLRYPESVTTETLQQIDCFVSNHMRGRGVPGVYERQFPWLATYFIQPLIRLGRLEYQLSPFAGGVCVWKRASDNAVLAVAEEGALFTEEGVLQSPDASASPAGTTRLVERENEVIGNPVDPAGFVLAKQVRLPRPAWQPCLRRGDTVLSLHIPAGGKMDWESVTRSFERAVDFFKRHHPDSPFRALVLKTWFMDPRLGELLPENSNPLKMQRAAYCYPTKPDPEGLWFIFFRPIKTTLPANWPADTSLQRSLIAFMQNGRGWNGGGMFMLPDDMIAPEENRYRRIFQSLRNGWGI